MTLLVRNFIKEKRFSNTKELMFKSLTFEITNQICNSPNFFGNLPSLIPQQDLKIPKKLGLIRTLLIVC